MCMDKILKILFVEDAKLDAELIWREIEKNKLNFERLLVDNRDSFIEGIKSFEPDLIISDYSLPQFDGMTALKIRNELVPMTPFILVTGSLNEEVAVECMKAGADDYILKENLSRLVPSIVNSIYKINLLKEKKSAEEELQKSERRLQRAQSIALVGDWELDLSSKSIWCSEEATVIYGVDTLKNEFPLEMIQKIPLPEYRPILNEAIDRLLKYNEPYEVEFKIRRINDGAIRFIYSKAEFIQDRDSNRIMVVGVIQDISERKLAEEEIIKAKEKAEESDKLKTAFLHNISHEIRTPMNAIVGFSTLLSEPDLDARSRQSYVDIIMQSSNHLLLIITDIVDISNIEANLVRVDKNEININAKLKTICDLFALRANEKKLSIICETGLRDNEAIILTDGTKLVQILSNLVNNALKFTDSGYIKLEYQVKDSLLEFCVSDTGIGIHEEYQNKIFDRFYQVKNSLSEIHEGTGLGLSISKAYIELMGGKIWIKSEPGKGTAFYFTVPYDKQVVHKPTIRENVLPDNFVFPERKKILIAEDVESNFKLLKYFLEGTNTEIIRAVNGQEAVDKCHSEKNIDLILMDVKMPVMDGHTAVRLIRETLPDIPIIAQTAYADDREKAIECGCNGFISKPFDRKELLDTLKEFI